MGWDGGAKNVQLYFHTHVMLRYCRFFLLPHTRHATLLQVPLALAHTHTRCYATAGSSCTSTHTRHSTLLQVPLALAHTHTRTRHATLLQVLLALAHTRHATLLLQVPLALAHTHTSCYATAGSSCTCTHTSCSATAGSSCTCTHTHTRHATLLQVLLALAHTRHATLLQVPLALAHSRHATLGWGGVGGLITFKYTSTHTSCYATARSSLVGIHMPVRLPT